MVSTGHADLTVKVIAFPVKVEPSKWTFAVCGRCRHESVGASPEEAYQGLADHMEQKHGGAA